MEKGKQSGGEGALRNREVGIRKVRGGLRFQLEIDNLGTKSDAAEEAAGVLRNGNGESIDNAIEGFCGMEEEVVATAKTPDQSLDDGAAKAW